LFFGQHGEAEVEDFDPVLLGDHHVGRLEVTMDDPLLVRCGQGVGDLDRQRK
jgi:hypothetical protein